MSGLFLILALTSLAFTPCHDNPVVVKVKVEAGEDVTLECVSVSGNISVLEWTREDLADDNYVFLYQDNKVIRNHMDPRFKDRVTLKHPNTRDTSIVLKNATVNDTGTYMCWVHGENQRKKRAADDDHVPPNRVIKLIVTDGEDGGSSDFLVFIKTVTGLGVFVAVCIAFHFLVVRRRRQRDILEEVRVVEVEAGDDVILKGVSVSGDFIRLEWTRHGLAEGNYVFFYQDNKVDEEVIDQRFQGRVTLKDSKTADIVLHDVTVDDAGIYLCVVEVKEKRYQKGAVKLTVTDGEFQDFKTPHLTEKDPGSLELL